MKAMFPLKKMVEISFLEGLNKIYGWTGCRLGLEKPKAMKHFKS